MVSTSSPGSRVIPELADLQALGGVAGKRDLFRIDAPLARHAGPHALALGLENLPHGVGRRFVRVFEVPPHGVLHEARRGADAAVVQIHECAVDGEGARDFAPEGLVGSRFRRGSPVPAQVSGDLGGVRGEGRQLGDAQHARPPIPESRVDSAYAGVHGYFGSGRSFVLLG